MKKNKPYSLMLKTKVARKLFPCFCCEFVQPVSNGKVFTHIKKAVLEVCTDCLDNSTSVIVGECFNCQRSYIKGFQIGTNSSKPKVICRDCYDSLTPINEAFTTYLTDAESVLA